MGTPETIACDAKVFSREFVLFLETFTSYNNIVIDSIDRDRDTETFTQVVNIFTSPQSRRIAIFLIKHQHTTQLELEQETFITRATISRVLQRLRRLGIIDIKAHVGEPWHTRNDMGPKPPIYSLINADPEGLKEAQIRYGKHRPSNHVKDLNNDLIRDTAILFMNRNPTGNQILKHLREKGVLGPEVKDHAEKVIKLLAGHGVKVFQ